MEKRSQLICLWSGAAFFPLYLIGFGLVAGFIPILSPGLNAEQVTTLFEQNATRILMGMALCNIAAALLLPWCVAIFAQMSRMDGGSRVFGYVQFAGGALGAVFFSVPGYIWSAMAFRAGHSPDTMLLLNDCAWIAWVISWPPFAIQFAAIGLCVLMSSGMRSVFPRWAGYLSLVLVVVLFPASAVVFFKSGPFAWNGLIGIYIPLAAFSIWFIGMFLVMRRAINSMPS